jgi:hypothetical protein
MVHSGHILVPRVVYVLIGRGALIAYRDSDIDEEPPRAQTSSLAHTAKDRLKLVVWRLELILRRGIRGVCRQLAYY